MCAALELNSRVIRPGRKIGAWGAAGFQKLIWAGFARNESLGWWRKKGGELVDVPAHRFAERSERTRQLAWAPIPAGLVVRGIVDLTNGHELLKVVTRASDDVELAQYEHGRMPLLEIPLYSAEIREVDPETVVQTELF